MSADGTQEAHLPRHAHGLGLASRKGLVAHSYNSSNWEVKPVWAQVQSYPCHMRVQGHS